MNSGQNDSKNVGILDLVGTALKVPNVQESEIGLQVLNLLSPMVSGTYGHTVPDTFFLLDKL